MTDAYLPDGSRNGYLVHLFEAEPCPGPRPFREHRHIWFELALFKQGHGTYQTACSSYDIEAGDVFVFSSNEIHSITEISTVPPLRLMNLHFDPRYFLDAPYEGPARMGLAFFSGHNAAFENRLPRGVPATNQIRELLLHIESEFLNRPPEYAWAIRENLSRILILLIREFQYKQDRLPDSSIRHLEAIRKTVDYIRDHLAEDLTLESIARIAQLSPNYFSSLFRRITGQALWDYVTARRIEHAMQLLDLDNGQTVLDIAACCGFNNTANFNRMFRKYAGCTPSEYRRYGIRSLY